MDTAPFIAAAYGISGLLLVGLCLATWLRVRRVARGLDRAGP